MRATPYTSARREHAERHTRDPAVERASLELGQEQLARGDVGAEEHDPDEDGTGEVGGLREHGRVVRDSGEVPGEEGREDELGRGERAEEHERTERAGVAAFDGEALADARVEVAVHRRTPALERGDDQDEERANGRREPAEGLQHAHEPVEPGGVHGGALEEAEPRGALGRLTFERDVERHERDERERPQVDARNARK
jgi:hypothetical protein